MDVAALSSDMRVCEIAIEERDESFYVVLTTHKGERGEVGPFHDEAEAQRAADDMQAMSKSLGAIDVPLHKN